MSNDQKTEVVTNSEQADEPTADLSLLNESKGGFSPTITNPLQEDNYKHEKRKKTKLSGIGNAFTLGTIALSKSTDTNLVYIGAALSIASSLFSRLADYFNNRAQENHNEAIESVVERLRISNNLQQEMGEIKPEEQETFIKGLTKTQLSQFFLTFSFLTQCGASACDWQAASSSTSDDLKSILPLLSIGFLIVSNLSQMQENHSSSGRYDDRFQELDRAYHKIQHLKEQSNKTHGQEEKVDTALLTPNTLFANNNLEQTKQEARSQSFSTTNIFKALNKNGLNNLPPAAYSVASSSTDSVLHLHNPLNSSAPITYVAAVIPSSSQDDKTQLAEKSEDTSTDHVRMRFR